MPGRGSYGQGGKWIHDRAHHILDKNEDLQSKGQEGKSIAYALATQQAHRVGKSPKGFRTSEGVQEAHQKYPKPKSEYKKTAAMAEAIRDYLDKESASFGMPAIPTPQFPAGLQKVTPKSVKSGPAKADQGQTSSTYTQVHTQPPVVNSAPFTGVKSVPPPPAK
ncbi:MAG: hypothetical protein KDB07_08120 [Planctomycetes bacterium]|nr:hypothetical protein [Planctomycetota bacterium]